MNQYIPGLTQWKISQICNLGKTTKTNPNYTQALTKMNNNLLLIKYSGITKSKYHKFTVTDTSDQQNIRQSTVVMLCDPKIHIFCIDSSMIWDVACSCNKQHEMTCVCEHACGVLLSLKDQDYRTTPLQGVKSLSYEVTAAYIKIGKVVCPSKFLPPCWPGPAYCFAVKPSVVLKWMQHNNASNAHLMTLLYLGIIPMSQAWCQKHNCNKRLDFERHQWICTKKSHPDTVRYFFIFFFYVHQSENMLFHVITSHMQ